MEDSLLDTDIDVVDLTALCQGDPNKYFIRAKRQSTYSLNLVHIYKSKGFEWLRMICLLDNWMKYSLIKYRIWWRANGFGSWVGGGGRGWQCINVIHDLLSIKNMSIIGLPLSSGT